MFSIKIDNYSWQDIKKIKFLMKEMYQHPSYCPSKHHTNTEMLKAFSLRSKLKDHFYSNIVLDILDNILIVK
jgi:hypothetical protein